MSSGKYYIAVDLGAESGRVILGEVAGEKLNLTEIHRFSNVPLEDGSSLRWNFSGLMDDIKKGIALAVKQAGGEVAGLGVDSWGVDFGMLDEEGALIESPFIYRDKRTDGVMEKAFAKLDRRSLYEHTGIQLMQINSLFQVLSMRLSGYEPFSRTRKILFMADLVAYHLCGRAYGEYSLASTSQIMDMKTGRWSDKVLDALSLPGNILPDVVVPGTVAGPLKEKLAKELGCPAFPVIVACSHDTAAAVAAVPAGRDGKWAYLSCGTWSLMGVEIPQAIINDQTYAYQFTNEGGVGKTIRLLKNIMGLWLLQECRRQWTDEGTEYGYAQLAEMAAAATPFGGFVDPSNPHFLKPGQMVGRINEFLGQTSQSALSDHGQIARAILESLALEYRWVMEKLEEVTGQTINTLHIVGGGIQNTLLCQLTADATDKRVVAGPVEATASGNILVQAMALGQVRDVAHIRRIVRDSFELTEYTPTDSRQWDKHYETFKRFKILS